MEVSLERPWSGPLPTPGPEQGVVGTPICSWWVRSVGRAAGMGRGAGGEGLDLRGLHSCREVSVPLAAVVRPPVGIG